MRQMNLHIKGEVIMKGNSHKKRTFIDRFARNYYCQHARLNYLRADKRLAKRQERHYCNNLCKTYGE